MGCNDYVDYAHEVNMANQRHHQAVLDDLGFDLVQIKERFADTTLGRCRRCGALTWIGDLTRAKRLTDAYLHYGWHVELESTNARTP